MSASEFSDDVKAILLQDIDKESAIVGRCFGTCKGR